MSLYDNYNECSPMYVCRYIYRLAEMQQTSGSYVEAAFTLLLHARLLQVRIDMHQLIMYMMCAIMPYVTKLTQPQFL